MQFCKGEWQVRPLSRDWQVRPLSQDQNQRIYFVAGATGPLVVSALLNHLIMLFASLKQTSAVSQKTIESRHADDDCRQDHFLVYLDQPTRDARLLLALALLLCGLAEPLRCTHKTRKRHVKYQHSAEDSSVSRLFG